ncbi:MAG: high-potential iron-sulfur protein [Roseiarcus sp.]
MGNPAKSQFVSRRAVLVAAAGAALALTSGSAEAKIAQTGVRYQDSPKDGKQCDGCKLFVAPNACKTVDGAIAPQGWCALWVKKG